MIDRKSPYHSPEALQARVVALDIVGTVYCDKSDPNCLLFRFGLVPFQFHHFWCALLRCFLWTSGGLLAARHTLYMMWSYYLGFSYTSNNGAEGFVALQ